MGELVLVFIRCMWPWVSIPRWAPWRPGTPNTTHYAHNVRDLCYCNP